MSSVRRRRAVATSTVHPEAEAYEGGSGPIGVLVLHGFSGSTKSMVPWARHLEAAGYRVSVPRLPGHGTTWQELNLTTWPDWYGAALSAFTDLERHCDTVFVAGLSMGGALALRLAEQLGDRVAGLALVNPVISSKHPLMPALPLLKLLPRWPGITNDIAMPGQDELGYRLLPLRALHSQTFMWADIQANLAKVDQPVIVFKSVVDHVGDPSSLALIKAGIKSPDQTYVELPRSYHVATLDYDAQQIFDGSLEFIQRLTGEPRAATENHRGPKD